MTLEIYSHVHGTVGEAELRDGFVAVLVGTDQLSDRNENDKTLAWLGGLISKNPQNRPVWQDLYERAIPRGARVEYLPPNAASNVTAWSSEFDARQETIPGAWTWQGLAPTIADLRGCVDALLQCAMRVNSNLAEAPDAFVQEEPGSKILTRTNITPSKTWQSKYSVSLAPRGPIDSDLAQCLEAMLNDYTFLSFEGSLASCDVTAFTARYPCRFETQSEAEEAVRMRDQAAIVRYFTVRGQGHLVGRPAGDALVSGAPMTPARFHNAQTPPTTPPFSARTVGLDTPMSESPLPPASVSPQLRANESAATHLAAAVSNTTGVSAMSNNQESRAATTDAATHTLVPKPPSPMRTHAFETPTSAAPLPFAGASPLLSAPADTETHSPASVGKTTSAHVPAPVSHAAGASASLSKRETDATAAEVQIDGSNPIGQEDGPSLHAKFAQRLTVCLGEIKVALGEKYETVRGELVRVGSFTELSAWSDILAAVEALSGICSTWSADAPWPLQAEHVLFELLHQVMNALQTHGLDSLKSDLKNTTVHYLLQVGTDQAIQVWTHRYGDVVQGEFKRTQCKELVIDCVETSKAQLQQAIGREAWIECAALQRRTATLETVLGMCTDASCASELAELLNQLMLASSDGECNAVLAKITASIADSTATPGAAGAANAASPGEASASSSSSKRRRTHKSEPESSRPEAPK